MQIQQIWFTVSPGENAKTVSLTAEIPKTSSLMYSIVSEYDLPKITECGTRLTWLCSQLLPETTLSDPLGVLTAWHSTPRGGDPRAEFKKSFHIVYDQLWEDSPLYRMFAAATEVARGRTGEAVASLMVVDDRCCVFPWEMLLHSQARIDKQLFPIVLRKAGRSIVRVFRDCHAHLGHFFSDENGGSEGHKRFKTHVIWATGIEHEINGGHPRLTDSEPLGPTWRGSIAPILYEGKSVDEVLSFLRESHVAAIHYIFAQAADYDQIVLTNDVKISSGHLQQDRCRSRANICAFFPLEEKGREWEARPWLPLGLAAHDWCMAPVLAVTTATPVSIAQSAKIARGLTLAAAQASKRRGGADPMSIVLELIPRLLDSECYNELENILIMCPPDVPLPDAMQGAMAAAGKQLLIERLRICATNTDFGSAIATLEKAGLAEAATKLSVMVKQLRKEVNDMVLTREMQHTRELEIVNAILSIIEWLETET